MNTKIEIAILLTCHDRRQLTEKCLKSVQKAQSNYNDKGNFVNLTYFITDDGCSDGTADMINEVLSPKDVTIIKTDGNAFWAGGMRIAWSKAIQSFNYDFYLLLNDDTEVWDNLFEELFCCHNFAVSKYGKGGIYSGNTTWENDHSKISYGGKVKGKGLIKRLYRINPNGTPQKCDVVNANILMVSSNVVANIGIFPECYIHGAADNDYGMRANNAGLPVLITPSFCGSCDAFNNDYYTEMKKLSEMTIKQRINYFKFPVKSIHDGLAFSIRWKKIYVPLILGMYILQILSPKLYYKIAAPSQN